MQKILVLGGSGLVGKTIITELNKCKEFETYASLGKRFSKNERVIKITDK